MEPDRPTDTRDTAIAHVAYWHDPYARKQTVDRRRTPAQPLSYRMKMGRETIWLDTIEYRIIRFLSARPYRACTRRSIAEAISTRKHEVREDTLDEHIASLRGKLGFFSDYIQKVPYIGYRFKA